MARLEGHQLPPPRWHAVAVCVVTAGFAIGATNVLRSYADSAGWCCVNTWAMVHDTFFVVLLMFGLLGFHLVRAIGRRLGLRTLAAPATWSWLPHVVYISGTLGTFVRTETFMWLGLVAGLAAVWLRIKGRPVQPFGLAIMGLLVSILYVAYWLYRVYIFWS